MIFRTAAITLVIAATMVGCKPATPGGRIGTGVTAATTQPDTIPGTDIPLYISCAEAAAIHDVPLYRDNPRWNPDLDPDGDGIACE